LANHVACLPRACAPWRVSRARTTMVAWSPGPGDAREVGGERGEPAPVTGHLNAVHPHRRVMVDGLEVQQHPLAGPDWRKRDRAAVPDRLEEVGSLHARALGLGRERHHDCSRQRTVAQAPFEPRIALVDLELPFAVERPPVRADELRARMLGAGQLGPVGRSGRRHEGSGRRATAMTRQL
jgi:hypothetical protein